MFFAKLFMFCHFCYSSKVPRVCLSHDCCLLVAIHKGAPAGSAGLTWDWRVWHHPVHPQWKYLSYEKTGRYMETIWNVCNCIRKHWGWRSWDTLKIKDVHFAGVLDQLNMVFTASQLFSGVRNYLGVPWLRCWLQLILFWVSNDRSGVPGIVHGIPWR